LCLLAALGNPPCVILGPGEPAMAHQTDEYCKVERLLESVDIYQTLLADFNTRLNK
jgi:succinyl-diaminopimelate desuccinylase